MSTYKIYDISCNGITWDKCPTFSFEHPICDPVELSNSLQVTIIEKGGAGIAAPQIGINSRVIYVRGIDSALFNPVVVSTGDATELLEEASFSFPGLVVKIKRPDVIRVRYQDAFGENHTQVFSGLTSRVIQRKIQLLDAQPFYKKAHKYHLDKAMKKWKNK